MVYTKNNIFFPKWHSRLKSQEMVYKWFVKSKTVFTVIPIKIYLIKFKIN